MSFRNLLWFGAMLVVWKFIFLMVQTLFPNSEIAQGLSNI